MRLLVQPAVIFLGISIVSVGGLWTELYWKSSASSLLLFSSTNANDENMPITTPAVPPASLCTTTTTTGSSSSRSRSATPKDGKDRVVLVIGSCGLDRLLAVPTYPHADAKVRTSAYHEMGGGNAANTATTMALLSTCRFLTTTTTTTTATPQQQPRHRPHKIRVQLCTKLGDDYVGKQLIKEMEQAGVDLSSPLFKIGEKGTTTGFTSVIVSEKEHTRTCLHTPGTCGELTMSDLAKVDMDRVFENVVHLHSDARHTDVALHLAKEARRRRIPVSLDVEKDRHTKTLDGLLEAATHIFTNSQQIDSYLNRLTRELEGQQGRYHLKEATVAGKASMLEDTDMGFYAHVIRPSAFFTRWYEQSGKQVILTQGPRGALNVKCESISQSSEVDDSCSNQIGIAVEGGSDLIRVRHKVTELSKDAETRTATANYAIRRAGVLSDVKVVDTTGAGDAFIGGYLLAQLVPEFKDPIQAGLEFGCWVGGRKLEGPGARTTLPTATVVDEALGKDPLEVQQTLKYILSPFCQPSMTATPGGESWETVERN
jgi:sugar/nucleoside kinase (ribokinase family)